MSLLGLGGAFTATPVLGRGGSPAASAPSPLSAILSRSTLRSVTDRVAAAVQRQEDWRVSRWRQLEEHSLRAADTPAGSRPSLTFLKLAAPDALGEEFLRHISESSEFFGEPVVAPGNGITHPISLSFGRCLRVSGSRLPCIQTGGGKRISYHIECDGSGRGGGKKVSLTHLYFYRHPAYGGPAHSAESSHLCHNGDELCINPEHLVFEPQEVNFSRDSCPGGIECRHLKPCFLPFRYLSDPKLRAFVDVNLLPVAIMSQTAVSQPSAAAAAASVPTLSDAVRAATPRLVERSSLQIASLLRRVERAHGWQLGGRNKPTLGGKPTGKYLETAHDVHLSSPIVDDLEKSLYFNSTDTTHEVDFYGEMIGVNIAPCVSVSGPDHPPPKGTSILRGSYSVEDKSPNIGLGRGRRGHVIATYLLPGVGVLAGSRKHRKTVALQRLFFPRTRATSNTHRKYHVCHLCGNSSCYNPYDNSTGYLKKKVTVAALGLKGCFHAILCISVKHNFWFPEDEDAKQE